MTGDGQGPESTQIAAVLQRDEGEGYDDKQDGLFVNMPPEEERGIAAERNGADKAGPGGVEEELDERDGLEDNGENECYPSCNLGQDGEGCVANETPGDAVYGVLVY